MARRSMLLLLLLVALVGVACSSDPTTSDEYKQLAEERAAAESDLANSQDATKAAAEEQAALVAELADSQAALGVATGAEEKARADATGEAERADEAETRAGQLTAENTELIARLEGMSAAVERARALLSINAADLLTGDPVAIAMLPDELLALREDLAAAIGWFDTPEEYHLLNSFRAFNRAAEVLRGTNVTPLVHAWDELWDAERGSEEQGLAALEYLFLNALVTLRSLDEALAGMNPQASGELANCVNAADALTFGTLLPVTGNLAFLGPPEVAGARLAIDDINATGGVLGRCIVLHEGDSGDTNRDIANPEVDRLLALGVHAIVGATSSAVSKTVIAKITGNNVIQISPSNTSDDFTNYNDGGLYFRTAPPDKLQGKVLADEMIAEGNRTVSVIYRRESYATGIADAFKANFEALGGTVETFTGYPVDTVNFDAEVGAMVAAGAHGILVIGFRESANILTTMHERGIGPTSGVSVWGVDGNIGGIGSEVTDPGILVGMQGTVPSVDLGTITDFTARLDTVYEGGVQGIFDYGAETYDAIVIVALAAQVAGTTDPTAIAAEINDVTRGGAKCTTYADCKALIDAGTDIDYDGLGGPYEFVDVGEPAVASFRIATYDGGRTPNSTLDRYVFSGG